MMKQREKQQNLSDAQLGSDFPVIMWLDASPDYLHLEKDISQEN